jgi:tetratricopeptide (TPR) repeat protein
MRAHPRLGVLLLTFCAFSLSALRLNAAAPTAPTLSLDERIVLVAPAGTDHEDRDIILWQGRVRSAIAAKQANAGSFERLGWAYIGKARRTLDAGYYKLAEKTADVMDARFGVTNESLLLRGSVDHNLHRFQEAETVARRLVANRGIAFDYALLSDALMEQGKLADSVAACQKMMALKPGVDAYSRAANLRWLTGDLPGAIVAMEAAVRAGSSLDATNSAWTLSRLSAYYLQAGRIEDSLRVAESAEHLVPDYPPALLAKGRALLDLGRTGEAVVSLSRAESLNPLPEYQWWLADTLRAGGDIAGAVRMEVALRARGEAADPRTYSLFLATRHEDSADAIRLATVELANRGDVFTQDALAWARESGGDHEGAAAAIQGALSARTQDARIFLHAGEIAFSRGQFESAQNYFGEAQKFAGTLTPGEKTLLESRLHENVGEHAPQRG